MRALRRRVMTHSDSPFDVYALLTGEWSSAGKTWVNRALEPFALRGFSKARPPTRSAMTVSLSFGLDVEKLGNAEPVMEPERTLRGRGGRVPQEVDGAA